MAKLPEVSYYSSSFVYFPLPMRNCGSVYTKRTSIGSVSYTSPLFVPYGLYARLALVAITNMAKGADDRYATSSVYDLLKSVRVNRPTGRQMEKMSSQLTAWTTSLITVSFDSEVRKSYRNLLLCTGGDFRLKKDREKDEAVCIQFTEEGREFLTTNSFPVPNSAVQDIGNAFDFDCLCWLIASTYQCQGKPYLFAPWHQIYRQFDVDASHVARFRKDFLSTLSVLKQSYYPEAKVDDWREGIVIYSSPLLTKSKNSYLIPNFFNCLEKTEK